MLWAVWALIVHSLCFTRKSLKSSYCKVDSVNDLRLGIWSSLDLITPKRLRFIVFHKGT